MVEHRKKGRLEDIACCSFGRTSSPQDPRTWKERLSIFEAICESILPTYLQLSVCPKLRQQFGQIWSCRKQTPQQWLSTLRRFWKGKSKETDLWSNQKPVLPVPEIRGKHNAIGSNCLVNLPVCKNIRLRHFISGFLIGLQKRVDFQYFLVNWKTCSTWQR